MQTEPPRKGPLTGIRVVEMGMLFAGPLVGTHLADLGADVVKIEPLEGDQVRNIGETKDGEGLWWRIVARNKRLLGVDMRTAEGVDVVRRLCATVDVVVENFRPGRTREWGLDYASLSAVNPGLVMLHISGYGQTGPYADKPGLGTLAEAFSGFSHVTGEADGPPTLPSYPVADCVTSLTGAYSVLAAIIARQTNGGIGDEIDLSLYESMLMLQQSMVIDYDQVGRVACRFGNKASWSAMRNTYRTRDGRWIVISSASNAAGITVLRAIGRPDLAADPTLATSAQRIERAEELDRLVADWVAARTTDEVLKVFDEYDVLGGPVNDVVQLLDNVHVQGRGTIISVDDPVLGPTRVQDVVPRFQRQPGAVQWLGKPAIGADTEEVLREIGIGPEDRRRLAAKGAIRIAD